MRKMMLHQMSPKWLECYENGIFTEFMEQRGPGHTVADRKIYTKGFLDFKGDIQKQIEQVQEKSEKEAKSVPKAEY